MSRDIPVVVSAHQAYARGVTDHDAGVPRDACPYTPRTLAGQWRDGWDDAERSWPQGSPFPG